MMKLTQFTCLLAIILFGFLLSCKTSESFQNQKPDEQTFKELQQSSVDTSILISLSPDEMRRITFMAQEAAQFYCGMKQFDDKDMNDIKVAKDYDQLYQAYNKIQNEVKKLGSMGLIEYERVFEEAKEKCE